MTHNRQILYHVKRPIDFYVIYFSNQLICIFMSICLKLHTLPYTTYYYIKYWFLNGSSFTILYLYKFHTHKIYPQIDDHYVIVIFIITEKIT